MLVENLSSLSVYFIRLVRDILLREPLRRLYFDGPDLKSFGIINIGFWNGMTHAEICAQLTTISEHHWLEHRGLCDSRIERQFSSFVVTVECVLYFLAVGYCVKRLFLYFFPDELTGEIRALRKYCEAELHKKKEH
jgi:hypothetical protein